MEVYQVSTKKEFQWTETPDFQRPLLFQRAIHDQGCFSSLKKDIMEMISGLTVDSPTHIAQLENIHRKLIKLKSGESKLTQPLAPPAKNFYRLSRRDRALLYSLREFVDANFAAEHSLKSLAREFGCNEFKLKTGFKSLFGTTIFNYLLSRKMDYAIDSLRKGNPVKEVATAVGYKNSNHFSTAFKRHFGVKPSSIQ